MHRINLTIDEALYEQARAFGFVEKKSISQILRDSLEAYFQNTPSKEKVKLILEAKDKEEILNILTSESFTSQNDFAKKYDL
ncbi:MAG: hypothetical protein PHF17_05355 [Arcobacteraceae bacterium]|jgi:hypothetical protein|nr:hypothetical protein [Arcobacteraceae bacterium]